MCVAYAAGFAGTVVAVAALAGCGDDSRVTSSDETRLSITVRPENADAATWTLTCDPDGGDHPNPEAACEALESAEAPFDPVPSDVACAEIYGGADTAHIEGTWRGEQVRATYERTNGCEMARWDALQDVLAPSGQ